ncbi:MAG TPA: hypothetical protein VJL89_03505 [Thermodesulfovibrionia bacterium]|nr:hypothetical protein [Thermodesulfovibrionia bacterium]
MIKNSVVLLGVAGTTPASGGPTVGVFGAPGLYPCALYPFTLCSDDNG